jgi:hypothetical protein
MNYSLGVDFGSNGGLALLSPCGEIEKVSVMPMTKSSWGANIVDVVKLRDFVMRCESIAETSIYVTMEIGRSHGRNLGKGAVSMGDNFGSVRSFFECLGYELHLVEPKKWQKYIFSEYKIKPIKKANKKSRDTKAMALDAVKVIYPGFDFRKNSRCKIFHDGIVDATLMARYQMEVKGNEKSS